MLRDVPDAARADKDRLVLSVFMPLTGKAEGDNDQISCFPCDFRTFTLSFKKPHRYPDRIGSVRRVLREKIKNKLDAR